MRRHRLQCHSLLLKCWRRSSPPTQFVHLGELFGQVVFLFRSHHVCHSLFESACRPCKIFTVASVLGSSWSCPASCGVLKTSLVLQFPHSVQGLRLAEYANKQLDSIISTEAWLCDEAEHIIELLLPRPSKNQGSRGV